MWSRVELPPEAYVPVPENSEVGQPSPIPENIAEWMSAGGQDGDNTMDSVDNSNSEEVEDEERIPEAKRPPWRNPAGVSTDATPKRTCPAPKKRS